MITMDNITIGYNGTPVITDYSLKIRKGDSVCLCGPSGTGKSTLLHLTAGLLAPCSGTCTVNTSRIAYAFQEAPLLPWLTVEENVRFIAGRGYLSRSGTDWKPTLQTLGLSDAAHKRPGELSGGMKKRAGLACALAAKADLLLLDEPFASLDGPWQHRVARCITAHVKSHKQTLLMVSHEMEPLKEMEVRVTEVNGGL